MIARAKRESKVLQENVELRARLGEAEETLRAIQSGEVDALVLGEQVYSLKGAETPYRTLIESMNEGAATLTENGTVLYCNGRLAEMLSTPLENLVGSSLRQCVSPADVSAFDTMLALAQKQSVKGEFMLQSGNARMIPVELSFAAHGEQGSRAVCVVATDITRVKEREHEIIRLSRLYEALSQINQAIVKSTRRDEMLEKICRALVELGGFKMVWIGQPDAETRRVNPVAKWGDNTDYLTHVVIYADDRPQGCGPTGTAIREGRSYISNDFVKDPNTLPWRKKVVKSGFRASAAFPIRQGGVICGALTVYSDELGFFRDKEITLLEEAANDVSFALDNQAREEARQRAEEKVLENEKLFRNLAESVPQIVWMTRPDGWNIYFNQHWVDYTGLTMEESYGHGWNKPFHPDDRLRAWDAWQAATTKLAGYSLECRLRRADGEYRWWLVRGVPMVDAAGKVVKWIGTCTDIHDLKVAEEQVRAERQRFSDVLDKLPAYLVLLAPDYHVPFANRFFRERFGESHGRRCYEYLFNRTEPCEICESYTALKTNAPHHWEWTGPDGRNYDIYDFPFKDTDGSPLIMEVGLDITGRKQAEEKIHKLNAELEQRVHERTEQLEFANKELESFSYSISHDLRAPLRAIDGFSRIVLEDCAEKLDDNSRANLQRVCAATQRMGQLIDDLLQLSRLTRSEMRRATLDLSVLVKSVADELQKTEPNRQVKFEIQPGLTADADEILMRAVLQNLIENAWKFTGKQANAKIEFGRMICEGVPAFFVRDNGVGFDMTYAHKLFGAFQRLHAATEFPGTGIGLATVQRIIHRHGGRVWAESEPNKGATFYFTLPTSPASFIPQKQIKQRNKKYENKE